MVQARPAIWWSHEPAAAVCTASLGRYLYWQATDKALVRHINKWVKAIQHEPFAGVGKPEPLKHTWLQLFINKDSKKQELLALFK